MNFDFLKDVKQLSSLYKNCNNAEKLAMTMPVQSVFTSRKSAELLAKFIYLAAHNEQMESMNFVDILKDQVFCDYINNRSVINDFHYIRKSGNKAVHGEVEETPDDALDVLEALHFVVGETARMLGLITDYPTFDYNVKSFPDAEYKDEEEIEKKALEMFLEYAAEYNAQLEREKYIEQDDYDWISYSVEGNVEEMHEFLEFSHKPKQLEIIEYIQKYLLTLVRLSIERSPDRAEELELSHPVTLDSILIIDEDRYSSTDIDSFVEAVIEKLLTANRFSIDIKCNGVLREYYNDEPDENSDVRLNMILKDAVWTGGGMFDTLTSFKRRNMFTYKLAVFYPDKGESDYKKILNGKEIDVIASGTEDIINKEASDEWWSYMLDLWAEFDFDKYHDKLIQLQEIVRTNIPKSEVPYCEGTWEDGELHILCSSIQWNCKSLKEVQVFLDKLNEVLLPIKDELDAGGEGTWEISSEFAVATWDWTDQGYKVKGICY